MGTLTILNEAGDTTLSWTPDRDEEMERIIRKKMDEGVTFFVVDRRGRPPAQPKRGGKLEDASAARKQRALVIPDEDLAKFVDSGSGTVERASDEPIRGERISRDAKEVAKSDSVGVRPRRGG
jgi:hypothetical protein